MTPRNVAKAALEHAHELVKCAQRDSGAYSHSSPLWSEVIDAFEVAGDACESCSELHISDLAKNARGYAQWLIDRRALAWIPREDPTRRRQRFEAFLQEPRP